jgi:hypothetical protein
MISTSIAINNFSTQAEIQEAISHLQRLLPHAPEKSAFSGFEELPLEVQADEPEALDPAAIFGGAGLGASPISQEIAAQATGSAPPPPPPIKTVAEIARESAAVACPAPPANVELDVAGHAWDERIHSGTRAKNKDGTWRTKRGVSAGVVAQVEAELKGAKPATVAAPGVAPPPPPPVADPGALKFNDVVKRVQAAISAGTLTQAALGEQCKALGLGSFPELAKRPDLFAQLLVNCNA